MTRRLTIKGRTGLFNIPSFLLSENDDLTIHIEMQGEVRVGKYRIVVKQGKKKKVFTLKQNNEITLSAEWLNLEDSTENLEFSLVLLDLDETKVIKDDYNIEPLKVERISGNFAFTAKVQAFEERQAAFEKMLAEFGERISKFEDEGVSLIALNLDEENEYE